MKFFNLLLLGGGFVTVVAFQNCAKIDEKVNVSQIRSGQLNQGQTQEKKITYLGQLSNLPGQLYPCQDHLIVKDQNNIRIYDSKNLQAPPSVVTLGVALMAVESYKISDNKCILRVNYNTAYSISVSAQNIASLVQEDYATTEAMYGQYIKSTANVYLMSDQSNTVVQVVERSNVPPGYNILSSVSQAGYYSASSIVLYDKKSLLVVWRKPSFLATDPESDQDQFAMIYDIANLSSPEKKGTFSIPRQYYKFLQSGSTLFAIGTSGILNIGFQNFAAMLITGTSAAVLPSDLGNLTTDEHGSNQSVGPVVLTSGSNAHVFRID